MTLLPYRLDRTMVIRAPRETVFRYFTDTERWASWWGAGSTIDPTPGGRVAIRYPGGVEVSGTVLDLVPPERISFTYGFDSGTPIPPGSSVVTIRLEPHDAGTRLHLAHEFAEPGVRDEHVQGWRYQLSLFSNVIADRLHAGAAATVDAWFDVWGETDAAKREQALAIIAAPDVRMRDRFSAIDGVDDLSHHIAAAQRFMPGVLPRREGDVRHCQGTVLAEWVVRAPDGRVQGRGTNVFTLGADGRVEGVTGFWAPQAG